ncbi:MAG TPA: hypothetical protein VJ719_02430 [Chthoniobacterales bacterium]|nr:hypothetical protein [Chthoniobacterales bacterium]
MTKQQSLSNTVRGALGTAFLTGSVALLVLALTTTKSQSKPERKGFAPTKTQAATVTAPMAPQDANYVGYENFAAPGVLVPVKTTEAGQQPNSVEYTGRNAGEPTIGSNFATGVAMFQSGLQSLFVTFNDTCPVNGQSASWVCRAAPTAIAVDSDPFSFTDRGFTDPLGMHSRSFALQLTLLSPNTVKISYTDDDGLTWVPTQTGGLASAVDHESMGGGPYHAPVPVRPPGTVYPYAIYYCSQDIAAALCSRSDDGGLTYGPSVPIYSLLDCGGLHGHVKVTLEGPQAGTVYVPNPECSAQAVVVSTDNGVTWTVRDTPIASPGGSGVGSDPAVGIDSNGKVYFLGAANGTTAVVATSTDMGQTWQNIFDVSSVFGIKQVAFPAAVAGSAGRAAVAFYGSTGTGNSNAATFNGVWHLYVAHTFDGGATWTTTNVTPNAPMQRAGLLRGGGANITRNLLDFFGITIDKEGRVLVGYVDGCEGGPCKQAIPGAGGNAYSTTATIARQSSGKRLLANFDPPSSTEAPGMPSVTHVRNGRTVRLSWSLADTGNSPITSYQILRGIAPNTETVIATVPATSQTGGTYTDLTATDITKTYYYKVTAINAAGTSCPNNEIAAPYIGNACTGLIMHKNDPTHPEANAGANTPPALLIDYVAMGEPADRPNDFLFKMKVNDLSSVPPNSRWRIVVTSPAAESYPPTPNPDPTSDPLFAQQFYAGMTTGPSGAPVFEYGTLADAGAPAVFIISETKRGDGLSGSNFTPDGTITIYVPKTAFGFQTPTPTAPPIGTLFGAVNGRTLTGDTSDCAAEIVPVCTPNSRLERSNAFVDHTFSKAQSDNGFPAATYTVVGANACGGGVVPLSAVSRKTHDSISPPFDIDLPLSGNVGIECRAGQGANQNDHQMVVKFPGPVSLVGTPTVSSGTGSVAAALASGNEIFINLTGVQNAQRLSVSMTVNDSINVGTVVVPMGVLLGDVTGNGSVSNSDVAQIKGQVSAPVSSSNFRNDITTNGAISNTDVSNCKAQVGATLP